MKLGSSKLWISLLSAAGVAYFVVGELNRESPGPLSSVHARDPDLTGFGSCSQCHGGWTSTMAESCLECHEDIASQLADESGLHGTFEPALAQLCSTCHSDHNGEGFQMVNQRSFALAGLGEIEKFDHQRIGFVMAGRHTELGCEKCHEFADQKVLPEGGKRFLGLQKDCTTCHEDAHEGKMRIGCASCHGQESFEKLHALDHDRHLALVGGHAEVTCRECHAKDDTHSLEILGTTKRRQPRQCATCHDSPHDTQFIAAVAAQTRKPTGATCAHCHTAEHTSFQDETLLISKEIHALSGFKLSAPHDKATCEDCHGGLDKVFAERHPGRDPDRCSQCHDDPHGGQFDTGLFARKGCVTCHIRTEFEPHAFTPDSHVETRFPLTGKHIDTNCEECHKLPGNDRPRIFGGTSRECSQCHGDAHGGFFKSFERELAKTQNGACAACHNTESFREHPEGGFDHKRFANFAITGAHAQVDCEKCHERAEKADRFGRTFGRLRARLGRIAKGGFGCVKCHTDPHRGSFDTVGRPRQVDGHTGCDRCHSHVSFRALSDRFDHRLWTGFALRDAHGKAECSDCHEPLRKPDEAGRTWGRAAGKQCSACHDDPHAGQFDPVARRLPSGRRQPLQADCGRCHRATEFKDLSFNHDIHSKFQLGERHKGVACSKCHKTAQAAGKKFIRYRPIARDCANCHGKQQDPFKRRREKK